MPRSALFSKVNGMESSLDFSPQAVSANAEILDMSIEYHTRIESRRRLRSKNTEAWMSMVTVTTTEFSTSA